MAVSAVQGELPVLLGTPLDDSFTYALANAYAEGPRSAGHEAKELRLAELAFDPNLTSGYKRKMPLEPGLVREQQLDFAII